MTFGYPLKAKLHMGQKCLTGLIAIVAGVTGSASLSYGQTVVNAPRDISPVFSDSIFDQSYSNGGTQSNLPTAVTSDLVEEPEINRRPIGQSNERVGVVERGLNRTPESDPFEPAGIQIGTLRLTTFFKQSIGYTNNQESSAAGRGGAFSLSEFETQLRSNWQRHELQMNASGEYQWFFDNAITPNPEFNIDGSLRLDLIDGFSTTAGANYGYATESATSPSLTATAINEPGVHSYGTFLEVARSGGRINLSLRGSIDRNQYDNAKLSNGGTFSQADRDVTQYGISARIGYQTGLAYSPFVFGSYSHATHDLKFDRNGEQRDSDNYELRAGIDIDLGEKFNGEVSAGYLVQEFVDPSLAALAGLSLNANLNWSPQRGTNVALVVGSTLDGSTTAGDGGAITYNGDLSIIRQIRNDLEMSVGVNLAHTDYQGLNRTDLEFSARAGLEYWVNRNWSFTGDLRYENLDSTEPGNSYNAASIMLGVKVQR